MIVNFTTRFGRLTMHGESAVALLRAAGHSGTVPGAILASELPAALAQLERALESDGNRPSPPPAAGVESRDGPDADEDKEPEPVVSLGLRAVPLLDMIRTAIARGSDLMWDRG